VVTLCKLLESLLIVSKTIDLKSDSPKLNQTVCSTFVFCYLWSIGGNITEQYWDAFDMFVHRMFEENNDAKVLLRVQASELLLEIDQDKLCMKFLGLLLKWILAV